MDDRFWMMDVGRWVMRCYDDDVDVDDDDDGHYDGGDGEDGDDLAAKMTMTTMVMKRTTTTTTTTTTMLVFMLVIAIRNSFRCRARVNQAADQVRTRRQTAVCRLLVYTWPTLGPHLVGAQYHPHHHHHRHRTHQHGTRCVCSLLRSEFMVDVPDPTMVHCAHERITMGQTIVGSHDVRMVVDGCS